MSTVIWKSPVPSSGYLRGVDVQLRPGREIALLFEFEGANEDVRSGELVFSGVVHSRTTYLAGLRAGVVREAYDQVVDVGDSPELLDLLEAMRRNDRFAEVRHYRVCFDDGPCFDFIAAAFEARIS